MSLTKAQMDFIEYSIDHLIACGICTPGEAAAIPRSILSAMIIYAELIEQHLISHQDFIQLNNAQTKLLKHPLIVRLIHKGTLAFPIAVQLPTAITALLSNELYGDFLLGADIKWTTLARLKKKHLAILLNPDIANSIRHGFLTFDHIIFSSTRRRKKLRLEKIASLLANQTLSLHDIDRLSVSKCELLNNHPLLREWLCQKIITPTELNLRSLTPLYISVFTKRLKAILDNNPYHLYNDNPDTPSSIAEEISLAEWHTKTTAGELQEKAAEKMIYHIQYKLEMICLSETMSDPKPLHRKLLHFIHSLDIQHETPQALLANIIEAATLYNKQPACGIKLFGKRCPDSEPFNMLCRQLNSLKDFAGSPAAKPAAMMLHAGC